MLPNFINYTILEMCSNFMSHIYKQMHVNIPKNVIFQKMCYVERWVWAPHIPWTQAASSQMYTFVSSQINPHICTKMFWLCLYSLLKCQCSFKFLSSYFYVCLVILYNQQTVKMQTIVSDGQTVYKNLILGKKLKDDVLLDYWNVRCP